MAEDTVIAPGIVTNPDRRGGRPTLRGTRIAVEDVLYLLAAGEPVERVLDNYPHLTYGDVQHALRYAADLIHGLIPNMSDDELDRLAAGPSRK